MRARLAVARLPRDLHPVAWWCWSVGLAVAASQTTNPWLLLLLIGVACLAVAARRSAQPWANSFRLYLWLGVVIVVIRVGFRILLGGSDGGQGHALVDLPEVPLPHWALGLHLLGPVTQEALLAGLYDGLRLAAIVICIGAANALANPKRLLRSVPPALYEIGSALVVAVTVLPQLVDSVRRVRAAQALRGGETGRVRGLRRLLVPVLEDALERSLSLAAGMDTRGYGRTSGASPRERRTTGTLMVLGLCGLCVGVYAGLDGTTPDWLGRPMLLAGLVASVVGMYTAGRRVGRTRYRPAPWLWPELAVALSGVLVGTSGWWMSRHQLTIAYPSLTVAPALSGLAVAAAAAGLAGALCAPPAVVPPGGTA
ncbi:energy-coupling factor transporter transmembrane component T [Nocardioides cynanchi]|uniref:energy-coupling factor transporter transmembrane component T n=1 Tax=Nocardioides cynanchi TaxID=2558918 RepID=UPI00124422EA|nr:energy-coupling factor transporter transmembrane component T [Nocardioides cynanchi]